MKKIFTSVDIGSDTVKILVSEFVGDRLNVEGSEERGRWLVEFDVTGLSFMWKI